VLEGRTIDQVERFDLLEFQQRARETCCPQKLFQLWEDICRRYERNEIGQYQMEEMKDIIWPNLQALSLLRRCVNDIPPASRESYQSTRQSA
jgi:hypothetical protein